MPARADQDVRSHRHVWAVAGPERAAAAHEPRAKVSLDATTGTLSLSVSRSGRTVIEPSPVGIVTEQADLSHDLHFLRRADRLVSERYRAKSGKRLERRVLMNESRLTFATAAGTRLDLVVRATADGVAYRYVLPAGHGDVLGETSAFNLPPEASAWLSTYRVDNEGQWARAWPPRRPTSTTPPSATGPTRPSTPAGTTGPTSGTPPTRWQTDSWMPQLVDYARAKGVGIVVWIHQRDLDTPAWDDTRLLAGQPGREAVLARRSGDRWFLGGVYAGAARTAEVPLSVGAGRWLVETIRDGADGLVQRRQVLRGGDTLAVDVVANGGFAGIACRWHPGVTTCYR